MSRLRSSPALEAHREFFSNPQAQREFLYGVTQPSPTSRPAQPSVPLPPPQNAFAERRMAATQPQSNAEVVSKFMNAIASLPFGMGGSADKGGSAFSGVLDRQVADRPSALMSIMDRVQGIAGRSSEAMQPLSAKRSGGEAARFLDQIVSSPIDYGVKQARSSTFPGYEHLDPVIADYLRGISDTSYFDPRHGGVTNMGFQLPSGLSYYGADRSNASWAHIPIHHGVDLVGRLGSSYNAPIPSTVSGTVAHVGYDNSRGNYVVVRDSQGYEHLYMHLNSVNVAPGQRLGAWDMVGTMGDTGNVTGAHLDYTVFDPQGRAVNPHNWAAGVYYPHQYPEYWGGSQYVDYRMNDPFEAHYSLPWR